MKNGAFSRCSMKSMYSATSASLWIGLSSSRNSSPLIRDSMSDSRKSSPSRLASLRQQRVADRVAVIVVDVLEIVDVEKCQRETALSAVVLQQTVDAMLDHAPRRQAGQFVVIGGAEQVILERLLFGDVGRTRDQQIASGNPDRPMRGEKHLFGCAAGNGFFQHGRAAGTQQFKAGFAAVVRLRGRRRRGCRLPSSAAAASFISTNSPCSS